LHRTEELPDPATIPFAVITRAAKKTQRMGRDTTHAITTVVPYTHEDNKPVYDVFLSQKITY
jgi:hypothetical protein